MSITTDHAVGGDTADAAKDQAVALSATAQQKASDVAGTAKEQATQVAGQARAHAQELAGQATDQLSTQTAEQTRRLASTLQEMSGQLATMAEAGDATTPAHTLVHEAAQRSGRLASYLQDREPRELLGDLQDFGRRRPGAFIAGAAVAGLLVGRLGKATKNAPDPVRGSGTGGPAPAAPQPVPGLASATPGSPTVEPVSRLTTPATTAVRGGS